ncbi:MAG: AI-2E family transporter [Hespellia sp.]|nr:AI-2E family transporter [Hespellia sp.]
MKFYLLLIAYILALILVVIHFKTVLKGIGFAFHLLSPLFMGITIAFVFNRPFEMFQGFFHSKWKLRKTPSKIFAIITIYILAFGACVLLLSLVIPEVIKNLNMFISNANHYLNELQIFINGITDFLGFRNVDISSMITKAERYLSTLASSLNNTLPQIIEVTASFVSTVATVFISIVLSVYILSGKDYLLAQLKRTVLVYLPEEAHVPAKSLSQIILQVFEDYVAGQCKEALILGSLCFAGMTILRLDYSGLVSVVITFTALVPIAGAYIGGAIGVILLLFVSPQKALIFLIFLIILQQFEGNVIYPRVVGRKIGLPGMWVLLSISVGGGLLGIWGMLISVPITTILYQLVKKDIARREAKQKKSFTNER